METINLDFISQIFDTEIQSLILAKSKISDNFLVASQLIANANKVVLSGIGKSGIIARKIAVTLASYNISAIFLHPVEALHGDIGIIQENDVVILLSKSGSTDEIVRLLPFIKSRNAKIISIVNNINSYLANNSDVVLEALITKEACLFGIAPTSSTTVTLVIGDVIAVTAAKMKGITIKDFSKTHPLGNIGRTISLQVKDAMHTIDKLSIMNKETTLKDAIISISQMGLGCGVVVDSDLLLIGFITDGDIRRALHNIDEIRNLRAYDVMTKNPITINQNEYLDVALSIMENRQSQINSLVVTDDNNKVVGVIRLHDIVRSGI